MAQNKADLNTNQIIALQNLDAGAIRLNLLDQHHKDSKDDLLTLEQVVLAIQNL
jgi:hypothetical protein